METLRVRSTDFQGLILLLLRVLAIYHCSILPFLTTSIILTRCFSDYVRLCWLPELRVFRGSILQVLPVLAVIWGDTTSIGNILGFVLRIYYCHYGQFFIVWQLIAYSHIASTRSTAVHTFDTSITLRNSMWRILKWSSVPPAAACRLASVALSSRCNLEPIIRSLHPKRGMTVHFQTVYYTARKLSDCWEVLLRYQ